MKFALFTGCVAKGATRELMLATTKAAEGLGIDFVEMKSAACCGAGVLSEKNPLLTDAINARNSPCENWYFPPRPTPVADPPRVVWPRSTRSNAAAA